MTRNLQWPFTKRKERWHSAQSNLLLSCIQTSRWRIDTTEKSKYSWTLGWYADLVFQNDVKRYTAKKALHPALALHSQFMLSSERVHVESRPATSSLPACTPQAVATAAATPQALKSSNIKREEDWILKPNWFHSSALMLSNSQVPGLMCSRSSIRAPRLQNPARSRTACDYAQDEERQLPTCFDFGLF